MLAIGLIAVGVQLDRETVRQPGFAALVPAPFRSFALYPIVDGALQNDPADAVLAARTLVLRRPIPSESLSDYGLAALANGKSNDALKALSLASARGWRDPVVQKVTANSALLNGDIAGAADRVAALWLTDNIDAEASTLTSNLLNSPDGRVKFAKRVAGSFQATGKIIGWGADTLRPKLLGATVADLRRAGAIIDCPAVSTLSANMVRDENVTGAETLWESACGRRVATATKSFAFLSIDAERSGPMDWSYPGSAGLDTDFLEDKDKITLKYENDNDLATVVAMIPARLPAGGHMAALLAPSGDAVNGLQMRVRCIGSAGSASPASVIPFAGSSKAAFSVPARDCSIQMITVETRRGRGSLAGLSLE